MTGGNRRRAPARPPAEPERARAGPSPLPDREQAAPLPVPTPDQSEATPLPDGKPADAIPIPDDASAVVIPIEDALDLHNFAPKDVAGVVADYLEECARRGLHEVRLIHGRGTGAQRALVQSLLRRLPVVAGFEDAPPERGGWGATVVFLRKDPPGN